VASTNNELPLDRGSHGKLREQPTAFALTIGAAAMLISARLAAFALFAALAAVLFSAAAGNRWRQLLPRPGAAMALLAALAGYACLSLLWAEEGGKAVSKLMYAVLVAGSAIVLIGSWREAPPPLALRWSRALWIGFLAGIVFLLIELSSGQAIQIFTYNLLHLPSGWLQPERHFTWSGDRLIAISLSHINRNLAVAALLAFPASMAAYLTTPERWRVPAAAGTVVLAAVAASLSRHESSMAALVAGLGIFGLATLSLRWTARLLGAGWVLACVAVLPTVFLMHQNGLHDARWLHNSLRHRIVIWNTTAEETMKAPVLGIGAYMTYVLMPDRNKGAERDGDSVFKKTFSRHAHNAYLQTWFELGAVGAALLAALGVAILGAIRRLASRAQPFALAAFASAATMLSTSYGIWQSWYLALFAFQAALLALTARAAEKGG
jgi:O-antigen ligase